MWLQYFKQKCYKEVTNMMCHRLYSNCVGMRLGKGQYYNGVVPIIAVLAVKLAVNELSVL